MNENPTDYDRMRKSLDDSYFQQLQFLKLNYEIELSVLHEQYLHACASLENYFNKK